MDISILAPIVTGVVVFAYAWHGATYCLVYNDHPGLPDGFQFVKEFCQPVFRGVWILAEIIAAGYLLQRIHKLFSD